MSNAQFTPKVWQATREFIENDNGYMIPSKISDWEWKEMVPGATDTIRGTVFISSMGAANFDDENSANDNEPNIFETQEDKSEFTAVSPVGVRKALQDMALCRETLNGDFIVPLDTDIKFIIKQNEDPKSIKELSSYKGSDTITINGQNEILVIEESLDAKHLNPDTGVIKVGIENPNTLTNLDSSYRFFIQV